MLKCSIAAILTAVLINICDGHLNYVEKFDPGLLSSQGSLSGAGESFSVNVHPRSHALGHGGPDTIVVPDAHLLFSGDYKRSGLDLVLSKDGHEFVARDYFRGDNRATLASPDGANITARPSRRSPVRSTMRRPAAISPRQRSSARSPSSPAARPPFATAFRSA